ncbi:cytochrome C oxidase subunit IV family protein [Alkalicoccobacillus plakortidis]|uniref:Cytochrome C oxidase subunit IV family protein n=1 Tax=Alkalicoccobacillus plakortidis TaxID=444060 RepID=A0ABT0XG42_9BACI|nr:cytochrome C oxidase subunit IV family protein [Alkalicoccobacillus plakortidis]MCM2674852.1 cytochrome C oxidase subunit IV family protein [Alkalicoccobacillus plakortidis]
MADHLSESFETSAMTNEEKRSHKAEIKKQIVAFALMIFLTFLAFAAVATDFVPRTLAIPFILILAVVQLALQLLFFMHMKDKDHAWVNVFMITGIFITLPTIVALMLLIGVTKY